jgi:PadR family transcriptional regulator, regulatory protein PadR
MHYPSLPAPPDRTQSAHYRLFLLTANIEHDYFPVVYQQETTMGDKADLLQGTLDILVLRTLASMGRLHGYGVARRIEQVSGHTLVLNQGTIYPALLRLEQRGWIGSSWGVSENNRRARFYSITRKGRAQLARATESWQRVAATMARFLEPQA